MKKIISIIVTAFLVISLMTGCSSNEKVTVEEFKENLAASVNIENYNEGQREDGSFYYAYFGDILSDYDLEFVLALDSETRISIPEGFAKLGGRGWSFKKETSGNIVLKPLAMTSTVCEKDGKEIMVFNKNTSEAPLKCSECVVKRVKIDIYSAEDNYNKKLKTAPDFKLGNEISSKSTMQDVIKAIGEPSEISYTVKDGNCEGIVMLYQNIGKKDFIKFAFSPDGKKMASVDYSMD